tara:strand:+ start:152 stop:337 length:186 start_codon:yes stop_codon:yes gene_type:complete
MCIICVQLQQNKLTAREARHNFYEMIGEIDQRHQQKVADLIDQKWEEEERKKYKYEPHCED